MKGNRESPVGNSLSGNVITLAALYVTQFLGIGFITVGLAAILRDQGTSLETLAVLQVVGVIWPVKVLWAPLVDRYGRYRTWLIVLQSGMVLALLALLPFTRPAESLGPVVLLCAVFVFLSATQDIAADAVAVRMLGDADRGTGNGVQVAASYVGNVLGGGLCVVVYDRFGWAPAVLLLAALTATGLWAVVRYREPVRTDRPARPDYRGLLSVLGRPGCRQWTFVVVPLVYGGAGAVYALVSPALVDAGWSLARIGVVTGVVVSGPAIVAGLLAGRLVGRFGRTAVLVAGGVALVAASLLLLPLFGGNGSTALVVTVLSLFMAAYTAANVALYTVNMDYARPASGGTDFTLLSSIGLIVSFLAASIALVAAGAVGYPAVAVAAAVLVGAGVAAGARHQERFGVDRARLQSVGDAGGGHR